MAHKTIIIGGKEQVVVDWEGGDPQGDRKYLFKAYRMFLAEVLQCQCNAAIVATFDRWKVANLDLPGDDFPRINVSFPDDVVHKMASEQMSPDASHV